MQDALDVLERLVYDNALFMLFEYSTEKHGRENVSTY